MSKNRHLAPHHKDEFVESVLARVNDSLQPLEEELIRHFEQPRKPTLLVAGPQRSGTTLLMQLLISGFELGYVNNLMARFWEAPYIGVLLAQELSRRQPHQGSDFSSDLGATYGYDGPHEFGFFWQRWLPFGETHQLTEDMLDGFDSKPFLKEIAAMEDAFSLPLVFKNPLAYSLNIPYFAELMPKPLFIVCQRDPLYVAQSTLLSRERYYGDPEAWWSIKPKEYRQLKELSYWEQVVGQVFYTEQRIENSLAALTQRHYIKVNYEDLCADPAHELDRIGQAVAQLGTELDLQPYRPQPFQCQNVRKLDHRDFARLTEAYERYYGTIED